MGKSNRREKDISVRREEILDAAERLFEKETFDSVSMEMIAKESEFTKQTLYNYFEGKEEILSALYLRGARIINNVFKERLASLEGESGYVRLDAIRREFVKIAESRPLYIRMMAMSGFKDLNDYKAMGIHDEIKKTDAEFGEMIADCIMRGKSDGSMASDIDPLSAALFLKSCISGTLIMMVYNKQFLLHELKTEPFEVMEKTLLFSLRAFKNSNKGDDNGNEDRK